MAIKVGAATAVTSMNKRSSEHLVSLVVDGKRLAIGKGKTPAAAQKNANSILAKLNKAVTAMTPPAA